MPAHAPFYARRFFFFFLIARNTGEGWKKYTLLQMIFCFKGNICTERIKFFTPDIFFPFLFFLKLYFNSSGFLFVSAQIALITVFSYNNCVDISGAKIKLPQINTLHYLFGFFFPFSA